MQTTASALGSSLQVRLALKLIVNVGIVLALGRPSHGTAQGPPEATVRAFYEHVGNHKCGLAMKLADGYSVERCQTVKSVALGSILTRVAETRNEVVVQAHVVVERADGSSSGCFRIPLVEKRTGWIIQHASIRRERCLSEVAAGADSGSSRAQRLRPAATLSPSPLQRSSSSPGHWSPAAVRKSLTPGLSLSPIPEHPTTLLQLWTPEQLAGQPGDERIVRVNPPDHSPPQSRKLDRRRAKVDRALRNSIRRVRLPEGKKLVALTFDLCEQADDRTGYDRAIVNYLREQQIAATFFAGGKWMQSHEDKAMQLMADPLFEIGNHTWTHGNLRVLKGRDMLQQLVWTQAEYQRIRKSLQSQADRLGIGDQMARVPFQPAAFRFPYGTCNRGSLRAVNALGMSAIQWDVVSGDPARTITPDALARGVINGTKAGSIIVFHANGRGKSTAAALPLIVDALRAQGYNFRTVSDLLREGIPESATECYERRPDDNGYIDAKFGKGTD